MIQAFTCERRNSLLTQLRQFIRTPKRIPSEGLFLSHSGADSEQIWESIILPVGRQPGPFYGQTNAQAHPRTARDPMRRGDRRPLVQLANRQGSGESPSFRTATQRGFPGDGGCRSLRLQGGQVDHEPVAVILSGQPLP